MGETLGAREVYLADKLGSFLVQILILDVEFQFHTKFNGLFLSRYHLFLPHVLARYKCRLYI